MRSTLSFVRVFLIHLVLIIYSDFYNLCKTDVTETHREGEPEKAPKSNWGPVQIYRVSKLVLGEILTEKKSLKTSLLVEKSFVPLFKKKYFKGRGKIYRVHGPETLTE